MMASRVVLWVIDGLPPSLVSLRTMPALAALRDGKSALPAHAWSDAVSVMVADTYSTHAALLTGARAAGTGIPSNFVWTGETFEPAGARHLRAETLFDALAATDAGMESSLVMADPRLHSLFGGQPVAFNWDPASTSRRVPVVDYPTDASTIDTVIARVDAGDTLVVANTQMVDLAGHVASPGSPLHLGAMRAADLQVRRLVEHLFGEHAADGSDTVLIIASDHSMLRTLRKIPLGAWLFARGLRGWHVQGTGAIALLAKPGGATDPETARVCDLARSAPGVEAAYCTGGELDSAQPGWHLDVEEAGHVVVAASKGWAFSDHFDVLPGTHACEHARSTMLVAAGHDSLIRRGTTSRTAHQVDVAPTISALLGIPAPVNSTGRVLEEALAG